MRIQRWFVALLASVLLAPCLQGQEGLELFPLDQVQPGLRGVGKTIFQGNKIEEFQVEVLGILKNALAPKRDVILARLSGGPLEKTGVIAGMSGSPVYVDGKLMGAVALSFPLSKEPIAGITPIEDMLSVVPAPLPPDTRIAQRQAVRIARVPGSSGAYRLLSEQDDESFDWSQFLPRSGAESGLPGMRLPLQFGGFPAEVIQASAPLFRQMGFEPMQGGALSGGEMPSPGKMDLLPGSMISLLLVRGDLNMNADCTVTYRKGDTLYACGHRFLLSGPAKIPFAPASVVTVIPNLANSFKIDAPGQVMGSITQDRFGAIYGVVGEKRGGVPVHLKLESTLNKTEEYNYEIIQEPYLTPFLVNLSVIATLSATERMTGPSSLQVKGKIRLGRGESIDIDDVVSADMNAAAGAGLIVGGPLSFLLNGSFPELQLEGIDVTLVARNERRIATLEQVWSSKSEVTPGDHIELTALLRTPAGEAVMQKIPVDVPESVNDKTLSLMVGGGTALNAFQMRFSPLTMTPKDLTQLVEALNRMRKSNRLYALLMSPQRSFVLQGDEYPSPPPSLVQTFMSDPAVASSVTMSGMSVVGDFETKPTPYTIRGQKTLLLKVVEHGG
ncbi:MAG: SpoIVB peptidase S55 domain-containing protein [Terriglobia bacterium]